MSGSMPVSVSSSPFTPRSSLHASTESTFPASFRPQNSLYDPREHPNAFLKADLQITKLSTIQPSLWLAGLSRPARPLHRQKLLGRTILLTECADEHLVWHKANIFIKPLPIYLLDDKFWQTFLCPDEQLFANATGLLLSYIWLVASTTDHAIAVEERIFPASVAWESWCNIVRDVLRNMESLTTHINPRYYYGELRLSRLNTLYRFNLSTLSWRRVVFGFMATPTWYTQFFERNFSWILAAFIYISVILSAMQVGLATWKLQNNVPFQNLSFGIALAAIAIVVVVIVVMLAVWVVLFWFHLGSTIRHAKKETMRRRRTLEQSGNKA
ncbi:hypothetical protein BDU57DRAFT_488758 [Ampelomyces quisqualis]|uniref:Uncharacterized protein n=1 Tax=Ampelomyces quisqualis TaxID=50730 RepID=A0A6A5R5M4_AMPQU|nr:hypothetical protein BDU57DRAFT_488758 [Ampelomyces quisqualis]